MSMDAELWHLSHLRHDAEDAGMTCRSHSVSAPIDEGFAVDMRAQDMKAQDMKPLRALSFQKRGAAHR